MRWTERTWPLALLALGVTGLLASVALNAVVLAPNRLLTGHGYVSIALPALRWLPLAWLVVLATARMRGMAGLVVAMLLLPALLVATGFAANGLLATAGGHARVQLGSGFWCMATSAVLLVADRQREIRMRASLRLACWIGLAMLVVAMTAAGMFDRLSIVQEFVLQRARFLTAVGQHLLLAFSATAAAVVLGAPLAVAVAQRRRGRGISLAVLNLVQTIPSMALFALLVAPLAWLGVGGTGNAPALVALTAYALLPVMRYTLAGLATAPSSALDAARGLGLQPWQVLTRVQLPLGLPVFAAGLRIVLVQSIGLAAVAALVGAGGLGRFVFLGLGQGANDLVMLGTLAIIALALAADGACRALERWMEPHA
ncbi:ABC transporter permease [Pinirhizobacter sp.]|jgi:osmoprotectant transport system permease protein|uniref:ABC transporter permease n=1 Tax=Pinirhizobacter sp. TaxID=2950432 RepID=UPI002F42984A